MIKKACIIIILAFLVSITLGANILTAGVDMRTKEYSALDYRLDVLYITPAPAPSTSTLPIKSELGLYEEGTTIINSDEGGEPDSNEPTSGEEEPKGEYEEPGEEENPNSAAYEDIFSGGAFITEPPYTTVQEEIPVEPEEGESEELEQDDALSAGTMEIPEGGLLEEPKLEEPKERKRKFFINDPDFVRPMGSQDSTTEKVTTETSQSTTSTLSTSLTSTSTALSTTTAEVIDETRRELRRALPRQTPVSSPVPRQEQDSTITAGGISRPTPPPPPPPPPPKVQPPPPPVEGGDSTESGATDSSN